MTSKAIKAHAEMQGQKEIWVAMEISIGYFYF